MDEMTTKNTNWAYAGLLVVIIIVATVLVLFSHGNIALFLVEKAISQM